MALALLFLFLVETNTNCNNTLEGTCAMKRFMILGIGASVCLALVLASIQAQERTPSKIPPIDRLRPGPKYAVADLAVIEFTGAYDGTKFHVGGKVKNVGKGEYSRTRSTTTGGFEGRKIQVYSVNPLSIGKKLKLLRTVSIPSLKANQTWATPSMAFSPSELYGKGNPKFVLMITAGDAERSNDSKEISVSYVR
jgi:hypothetical protein